MGNRGGREATPSAASAEGGAAFDGHETTIAQLRTQLQVLITYAQASKPELQREVAERLANEAVKADRRAEIVELGGLRLLMPLTKSKDVEVKRLAAHALANLSVDETNQVKMAAEGGVEMLVRLLAVRSDTVQRQAAKALANLGVHKANKLLIAEGGAVPPLIGLVAAGPIGVQIEAVAALANLAVNDRNEALIAEEGGIEPIVRAVTNASTGRTPLGGGIAPSRGPGMIVELQSQCARALRNLSVRPDNKDRIRACGGERVLRELSAVDHDRIASQASRALRNMTAAPAPAPAASEASASAGSPAAE